MIFEFTFAHMIHCRLLCPSVQWKLQEANSLLCFMALTGMVSASPLNLWAFKDLFIVTLYYYSFVLLLVDIWGMCGATKNSREIGKYSA